MFKRCIKSRRSAPRASLRLCIVHHILALFVAPLARDLHSNGVSNLGDQPQRLASECASCTTFSQDLSQPLLVICTQAVYPNIGDQPQGLASECDRISQDPSLPASAQDLVNHLTILQPGIARSMLPRLKARSGQEPNRSAARYRQIHASPLSKPPCAPGLPKLLILTPMIGGTEGGRLVHVLWVARAGTQHRQMIARNLVRASSFRPSRP